MRIWSTFARAVVGLSLVVMPAAAEDQTPPAIPGWDQFVDGLRDLAPQMLGRLPPALQHDPQVQQEVGRLMLEILAATTITAVSADGDHPVFLPWANETIQLGQPNADTTYRIAKITPGGSYRLRGERGSLRIARIGQFGQRPPEPGRASLYTITYNDLNALNVDAGGHYDVILSPQRPPGYTGDWWKLDDATAALMIRMVSGDWSKEHDPTLSIERLDKPAPLPRRSAADLEARLKALTGQTAEMATLLVAHAVGLERDGYVNKLKVFDVSQIGGQLTGQFYYEGAYDLKNDEALIIEAKVPDHCQYYSMIVTNEIYETIDWYNNHSSLNDSQMHVDKDGMLRVVVSGQDPGVANWLDTAGYPRGVVQGRWTECSAQPVPTVKKVTLRTLRKELPKDTIMVTSEQRDANIRQRRSELQQRPLW